MLHFDLPSTNSARSFWNENPTKSRSFTNNIESTDNKSQTPTLCVHPRRGQHNNNFYMVETVFVLACLSIETSKRGEKTPATNSIKCPTPKANPDRDLNWYRSLRTNVQTTTSLVDIFILVRARVLESRSPQTTASLLY